MVAVKRKNVEFDDLELGWPGVAWCNGLNGIGVGEVLGLSWRMNVFILVERCQSG